MRLAPVALAAALLLALVGCVPTGDHATTPPSASATPVFASDAEALAAAEKAYAAYLKVSTEISSDGGKDPHRIDSFVTADQVPRELETYKYFSSNNLHTEGNPTFSSPKLEQLTFDESGAANLTFYTCVDATDVRVLDSANADVTPTNRDDRAPLEVTVISSESRPSSLLIAESSTWTGPGVCS